MANFWDRLNNLVRRKITRRRVPTSVPYGQTGPGFYSSQVFGSKLATSIYEHNLQSTADRLARIRDYDAMDTTPIVSTALNVYCLRRGTKIPLLNGSVVKIEELLKLSNEELDGVYVYSYDIGNRKITSGKLLNAMQTGKNVEIWKLTLDDNTIVETTPEHKFMLRDGSYKMLKDLKENDFLMPFYTKLSKKEDVKHNNHKVKKIEFSCYDDVYDLTVEKYSNFAIVTDDKRNGIFVHNSDDASSYGEDGQVLTISCNNQKMLEDLEYLFYDILNVDFNIYHQIRTLCKYGDKFELLSIEKGKGVTGTIALPTAEIEREEAYDGDPTSVRFRWVAQIGAAYNEFQVAHFRLMGDDNFLPYGRCLKWDSYIETPTGFKMIKDIKIGDEVYSFDTKTEKKIITTVKNTVCSGKKQIYKIKSKNNELELSKEHNIMIWDEIENKFNYKNIYDLKIGDKIVINKQTITDNEIKQCKKYDKSNRLTDEYILTPIISIEKTDDFEDVYDIYIDEQNHNFFANGIVVHNSVLESGRGIWKKLQLLEDAMLIYRISRAAEKRVFQIEVGNIPFDQIENYIEQQRSKIKTETIINPSTGEIDLRYRVSALTDDYWLAKRGDMMSTIETLPGGCLALNTKIALLDGRNLELQEIIKEYEQGKQNWVYSCNPKTGEPCVAPISWAGITKRNTQVLKLTLDNNSELIVTPEHKMLKRSGEFISAEKLKVGDSLMPFVRKINSDNTWLDGYEKLYDNNSNKWVFTHRLVKEQFKNNLIKEFVFESKYQNAIKNVIHHKDFNKRNNNPSNLVMMNNFDHLKLHQEYCRNPFRRKAISSSLKYFWKNQPDEYKTEKKNQLVNGLQNKFKQNPEFKKKWYEKAGKTQSFTKKNNKEVNDKIIENNKLMWRNDEYKNKMINNNSTRWNNPEFRKNTSKKFSEIKKYKYDSVIHKYIVDAYKNGNDDGDKLAKWMNESEEFKNKFYELNPIAKHYTKEFKRGLVRKIICDLGYDGFRDFKEKVPMFNHKVIKIEWLEEKIDVGTITVDGDEIYTNNHTFALSDALNGCAIYVKNSNLNDIEDVEYVKQQLITSLGVPKAFLQFEDDLEGKSSASKVDMRFARTIQRIQKIMISEFTKIAILHLFAKEKYDENEIFNFELKMHNPSAIMELGKLEIMEKRFDIYNKAVNDSKAISMTKAKKEILNMTDEELKDEQKQLEVDAKFSAKVQKLADPTQQESGEQPTGGSSTESSGGEEQDKLSDMLDSLEADSLGGEANPSIKQSDKGELKTGSDYDLAGDSLNGSIQPNPDKDVLFENIFSKNGKLKLVDFLKQTKLDNGDNSDEQE
jgi:intein/homing endonuclease